MKHVAAALLGISDTKVAAVYLKRALIAYLPALFGVEWRLVQHQTQQSAILRYHVLNTENT